MSFNYAREYRKFEKEQEEMVRKYKAAGMTYDQIAEMLEYDKKAFNRNRAEFRYRFDLDMDMGSTEFSEEEGYTPECLIMEELNIESMKFYPENEDTWLESIQFTNEEMWEMITSLSKRNIRILYMFAVEGYSQNEISEIVGIGQTTICYQLNKMRDRLVKFL